MTLFIRDNGEHDSDSTPGVIRDPGYVGSVATAKLQKAVNTEVEKIEGSDTTNSTATNSTTTNSTATNSTTTDSSTTDSTATDSSAKSTSNDSNQVQESAESINPTETSSKSQFQFLIVTC